MSSHKRQASQSAPASKEAKAAKKEFSNTKWLTLPDMEIRPAYDDEEDEEGDDDNEDLPPKLPEDKLKQHHEKYKKKPLEEHPGWKWVVSEKADKYNIKLICAAIRCDQEAFEMYIYNDWPGYGHQEILENTMSDFHKEWKKKDRDVYELWTIVTALGLWAINGDWYPWAHQDDAERVGDTAVLLGKILLASLEALDGNGSLKPDSDVPNIAFVASCWLELASFFFGNSSMDDEDGNDWPALLIKLCQEKGIELSRETGVWKTPDYVKAYEDKKCKVKGRNFNKQFGDLYTKFVKTHGHENGRIGGNHYDITRMTVAQRKTAHFDNKDPIALMKKVGNSLPESEL